MGLRNDPGGREVGGAAPARRISGFNTAWRPQGVEATAHKAAARGWAGG